MTTEMGLRLIAICALLWGVFSVWYMATADTSGRTGRFVTVVGFTAWGFLSVVVGAGFARFFRLISDHEYFYRLGSNSLLYFGLGWIPATIALDHLGKMTIRGRELRERAARSAREAQTALKDLQVNRAFLRACHAGNWNAEGVRRVLDDALATASKDEQKWKVSLVALLTYWEDSETMRELVSRLNTDHLFRLPSAAKGAKPLPPPFPTTRSSFLESRDRAVEELVALVKGVPDERAALEAELREWEEAARFAVRLRA